MIKFNKNLLIFIFSTIIVMYPDISLAKNKKICEIKENRVKKIKTPLSKEEILIKLNSSHTKFFGFQAKKQRIVMAWAQVAIENAAGKVLWNNNFGNIGPFKGEKYYRHSHLTCYRSFDKPEDGALAYWAFLNKTCSSAFVYFDAGDYVGASKQLKRCNYYGATIESYVKAMRSLYYSGIKLYDLVQDG